MDCDLTCNMKKCRKRLSTGMAWATSCSHIFCNEDGENILARDKKCPACSANLSGKLDIVRLDMNPHESYKTMVLAGQRPDVILEICNRAMSFWTYQNHQEHTYQEYLLTRAREKHANLTRYCNQAVSTWEVETKALKAQIASAKSEAESLRKMFAEAEEKIREKNRQYQKLLSAHNSLRRTSLQPPSRPGSTASNHFRHEEETGQGEPKSRDKDFLSAFDIPMGGSNQPSRNNSPFNKMHRRSPVHRSLFNLQFSHPNTPFMPQPVPMATSEVTLEQRLCNWAQTGN